jgi:hypothetical protein
MEYWNLIIAMASVLATLVLGIMGIMISMRRNRKLLSYQQVSMVPIVTVLHDARNTITEELEIRYRNERVKDVWMVIVRLWNPGTAAIVPSDYVEHITVHFGGQMLASDVIDTQPKSLRNNALEGSGSGPDHSAVALFPVLLNPGDSVTVQAVLSNFNGKVELTGHIIGVAKFRQILDTRKYRANLPWPIYILTIAWFIVALLGFVIRGNSIVSGLGSVVTALLGIWFSVSVLWAAAKLAWRYVLVKYSHG